MAKMTDIHTRRLFTLLRLALSNQACEQEIFADATAEDWKQIYNLALEQGVLAIVYDGIQRLEECYALELETKIQWAYNVSHIEKIYAKQVAAATKLTKAFASEGITTLILKGLSTASLYPVPSHRSSGDIDIYLMGQYERANALISAMGNSVHYDYFVHSEFIFDGINIENHRYLINPFVNRYAEYLEEQLELLATKTSEHPTIKRARMACPEFSILFYLRHASWHFARESIRLRDICDWAIILSHFSNSAEWNDLLQCLEKADMKRFAAILTTVVATVFGSDYSHIFGQKYEQLSARVLEDILTFSNPQKYNKVGFIRAFTEKIRNRISRKWCYDSVVPDSYWGNIWFSIKGYISKPKAITKAKL